MDRKGRSRTRTSEGDLPSCDGQQKALYLEKVRESSEAIQRGEFQKAVKLYTEALALDPKNYILYSNRSATYIKLKQYDKALKDARKAKELNQNWPKGYYREGVALQCLGRVAEALASYSAGLVNDPNNNQLLSTLVQACLQSPLKEKFAPTFDHLQKMKLDESPFVTVSVIGQELLASGFFSPSVTVLESALRIGSCSLKLRGSVFSALSTAHWGLGNIDKAIACMQQDLAIAKSLGDQEGECRVHGNLGSAYFSKGTHREALQHHRFQLVLAMRQKDTHTATSALSSLGHVYTAIGDYTNALASHKQCALLSKQIKDQLQEAREIGNMGAVFLALGEFNKALDCHNEHMKIAKDLGNKFEEARAYSNMGSAHHYKRDFDKAVNYHNQVLNIAMELNDKTLEARAYAGLGHATRCMQDYVKAKYYHEKQLDNALQTKDKVAEGRSCSNLGIIYHQLGEFDAALKLHKAHLQIAKDLGDRASQGRAYGNIGNAHSALGQFDLAVRFHKQELAISKEVMDRHSEAATHGNLAVAYQSLQMYDKALQHYTTHMTLAKELKDTRSEARALNNLGNYYSSRKDYSEAIPLYEQYLALSQELHDVEGEGRACHKLGYVHYSLGNYREAIRYYDQDLALAKDLQDKASMCRAYCNLGLAHKALEDYTKALECQKYFLATTVMSKNLQGKFIALGNIGDLLSKMDNTEEAVQSFDQQLALARQLKDRKLEAVAFGNLGSVHKKLKHFDKALGHHNQELLIYQEINDLKGECRAHGSLGNIHVALRNYSNACRCYEEQLDRSRDLSDSSLEAHAYGNLGITKLNMGHFNDAIGYFESQLAMLEQVSGYQSLQEKGHALCNLASCHESLVDHEEAVRYYEQYLAIAQSTGDVSGQDKAYRCLGNAHRAMGNLQQALVCFEKRLVVAHELDDRDARSSAYGELGCLHSLLGNFEQAISCLRQQLRVAVEIKDKIAEGEAACGLGGVYQQMGEYDKALENHSIDLRIAKELNNAGYQCRAYGNLGLTHESMGNFQEALNNQEKHLSIANETNDKTAKTLAYSSLGRIHHAQGHYEQAVQYLQQGLVIADQGQHPQDEAKIRHRLGLSLWGQGDYQGAQKQLYCAIELFERIRREAAHNSEYKMSLFDLQTASYQALQRVLVALGRNDDALVVAERGRTRAFIDLLLERQTVGGDSWYGSLDSSPVTKEGILETINKQRAGVLYFSMAAGYLYSWLILPEKGIVKFHESSVNESDIGSDPEDSQSIRSFRSFSFSTTSLLDAYVGQARETLGVESHLSSSRLSLSRPGGGQLSETESEADDLWQQHLEEIGEKLNSENDHTGFLRMERRDHIWNASSYSLGSMLSFSSGLAGGRSGSIRSKTSSASTVSCGKPPLGSLYELLIKPMEDVLPPNAGHQGCKELILVLQGDLYLVPFALLKSSQTASALCERYNLLAVSSLRALQASQVLSKHIKYNPDCTGAVVIGNPKLHQAISHMWQWAPIPATEHECRMVSEMMGCRSLTGSNATKDSVLREIPRAELLHFATHVSWKLAAIVLSPSNFSTTSSVHGNLDRMDLSDSSSEINVNMSVDGPALSEFLITAADILNMRLNARLVVLSSGYSDDRAGRINTDGVVGLTRAFLAAGAQCILFSLWPVPDMAARMLMKSFYTAMLQGAKASHALSGAMQALQNSRQFSHPSNWASWMLVGSDVKLSSKVALMGHALCQLLKTPEPSREAMRVILHLVEKSLQRIHHGQRKAMYTTQQSIENKVCEVQGWRDLLTSVGFRLEPSTNELPSAVFFPTFDPGDRLAQCSASLQALLGLSVQTLMALSEMIEHPEVGEMVISVMRDANARFDHEAGVQVPVNLRLWRAPGVHEFLASLGFATVEAGKDEVTLRVGKHANRRMLQFGLQSLVAVFDTQEAPRTLLLDSSSSMESLCSSGSATSTSNFSKGSSPPTSPVHKRKSFFNPAEVDKLPSAKVRQSPCGNHVSPRTVGKTDVTLHLNHQSIIREKYSSPSGSDLSDANMADPNYPRVLSVDTGDGSCPEDCSELRHSKRSERSHRSSSASRNRSKNKSYAYSTSASDSEDGIIPENNLSRAKSRSSQSLASQASTITIKSTGSGTGGFRRNRSRASVASTRSSASDRTLTGSQETLVDADSKTDLTLYDKHKDNLSDSGIHSKHTDTATDNSADNDGYPDRRPSARKREKSQPTEEYKLQLSSEDNDGAHWNPKHKERHSSPLKDPTSVARKVLAETGQQRAALEAMQRWSVQSLQQKQKPEEVGMKSNSAFNHHSGSTNSKAGAGKELPNSSTMPTKQKPNIPPAIPPKPEKVNTERPSNVSSVDSRVNKMQSSLSQNHSMNTKHNFLPPVTSKPQPILANSLSDSSSSYTCKVGERVSILGDPLDIYSQSELDSDPELSVIEEESEGVSDLNASHQEDDLSVKLRSLRIPGSLPSIQHKPPSPVVSQAVPWYEDSMTEDDNHSRPVDSSTPQCFPSPPGNPKAPKSVTFQDEVEMEILSHDEDSIDQQTDHDKLDDINDSLESCEMSVDGDPSELLHQVSNSGAFERPVSNGNGYVNSNSTPHVRSVNQQYVSNGSSAQTPPIGYKAPPPYPGQRRRGSIDSNSSADSYPGKHSTGGVSNKLEHTGLASQSSTNPVTTTARPHSATVGPSRTLSSVVASDRSSSESPHDGLDLSSKHNLQRMSKQFYQMTSPPDPQRNGFRTDRYPHGRPQQPNQDQQHYPSYGQQPNVQQYHQQYRHPQEHPQQLKPQQQYLQQHQGYPQQPPATKSYSSERSYDATGALRTVTYQPPSQQHSNSGHYPDHNQRIHNQAYPHSGYHPRPNEQGYSNGQVPNYHPQSYPSEHHKYPQNRPYHHTGPASHYPGVSRKEWYHGDTDSYYAYQGSDNSNIPSLASPRHRVQGGVPHWPPPSTSKPANTTSPSHSMSSHDSYAEMRSIFPGACSPQHIVPTKQVPPKSGLQPTIIPDNLEGSVVIGNTVLHASKC